MPYKDPVKRTEASRRRTAKLLAENPNYFKDWLQKNPETPEKLLERRYKQVFKFYGLSKEVYLKMIKEQDNKCLICAREESATTKRGIVRPLCVDHCHTTGKVRGLLCNHCNSMLGHAKDNPKLLQTAIEYLKQYSEEN